MKINLELEIVKSGLSNGAVSLDVRSSTLDADGRLWTGKCCAQGSTVREAANVLARDPVFAQSLAQVIRHRVEAHESGPVDYLGYSASALKRLGSKSLRKLAADNGVDISGLGANASALALRTAVIDHCEESK